MMMMIIIHFILQCHLEVEKEMRKIAPLYKLVLEVIPHIIKNQLTL